jgi:hypothetical protein
MKCRCNVLKILKIVTVVELRYQVWDGMIQKLGFDWCESTGFRGELSKSSYGREKPLNFRSLWGARRQPPQ